MILRAEKQSCLSSKKEKGTVGHLVSSSKQSIIVKTKPMSDSTT